MPPRTRAAAGGGAPAPRSGGARGQGYRKRPNTRGPAIPGSTRFLRGRVHRKVLGPFEGPGAHPTALSEGLVTTLDLMSSDSVPSDSVAL
ncbi:hypothetical protein VULLAG_LOCUS2835 [Vulpes lagopus]